MTEHTRTHVYQTMDIDMRPQDPHLDGTGLTFETLEHGGEYPDAMPQAIRLTDAEGRNCTYLPVTVDGKVVLSICFSSHKSTDSEASDGRPPPPPLGIRMDPVLLPFIRRLFRGFRGPHAGL